MMTTTRRQAWLVALLSSWLTPLAVTANDPATASSNNNNPVQVFVLAGDDAALGHASIAHLRELLKSPFAEVRADYRHLIDDTPVAATGAESNFVVRNDVFVSYDPLGSNSTRQTGPLTIGCNSNEDNNCFAAAPDLFGPEVEMGHVLGNVFEEPVVIIKATYAEKTLGKAFLPAHGSKRPGKQYRQMMSSIEETVENLGEILPKHSAAWQHWKRAGHAIRGLVWFHGYSDFQVNVYREAYASHLNALIQSVKKDLAEDASSPEDFLVVVGEMGGRGKKAPKKELQFRHAQQQAVHELLPESMRASVALVPTAPFFRPLDANASQIPNLAKNYEYYMARADTMIDIGGAFASALLELGFETGDLVKTAGDETGLLSTQVLDEMDVNDGLWLIIVLLLSVMSVFVGVAFWHDHKRRQRTAGIAGSSFFSRQALQHSWETLGNGAKWVTRKLGLSGGIPSSVSITKSEGSTVATSEDDMGGLGGGLDAAACSPPRQMEEFVAAGPKKSAEIELRVC